MKTNKNTTKKSNRRSLTITEIWRKLQQGFTIADRSWNPIMAE